MSLRLGFAVATRILREHRRSRRVIALWVVFPAAMLVLFGYARAEAIGAGRAFSLTAPGILIGAGLFFSCLGGPIALLVSERERKTLRRLLVSPLDPGSYFLGVLIAYSVIAFGQVLLVYGTTLAAGGRFEGSRVLGAVVLAASVSAYVGLGFVFGCRVARTAEDVNGAVAGIGVPLLVLGGTFFPAENLPALLRALALANPIFHMNQAFRPVAAQGAGIAEIGISFWLLLFLAAVSMALGIHSYRRMLGDETAG